MPSPRHAHLLRGRSIVGKEISGDRDRIDLPGFRGTRNGQLIQYPAKVEVEAVVALKITGVHRGAVLGRDRPETR